MLSITTIAQVIDQSGQSVSLSTHLVDIQLAIAYPFTLAEQSLWF